jgi:hypothetical protein
MVPASFIPADTSPEAWAVQTEIYRRMTGAQRTGVVFRLNALARETSSAGIRSRHPGYSDDDVKRALFRLMHGDALTRAVWPSQPLLDP